MHQLVEFVSNHVWLVGAFLVALVAVLYQEMQSAGVKEQLGLAKAVDYINNQGAMVLDVRNRSMFESGHIAGAKSVLISTLQSNPQDCIEAMDHPVLLVCAKGTNTGALAYQLKRKGYEKVKVLTGGMTNWVNEGMPVVKGKK